MCNIRLKSLEVGDIWNDLVGSLLFRDYVVTSLHFCELPGPYVQYPLCSSTLRPKSYPPWEQHHHSHSRHFVLSALGPHGETTILRGGLFISLDSH